MAELGQTHMAWCKQRAMEYLDRGELAFALSSFLSDVSKNAATKGLVESLDCIMPIALRAVLNGDSEALREWIDGWADIGNPDPEPKSEALRRTA